MDLAPKSSECNCTNELESKYCYFIHNYNTRLKNKLRLPKVMRNWGKYMMNYHATSDWNALDEEIITSEPLKKFKSNFFLNHVNSLVLYLSYCVRIVF